MLISLEQTTFVASTDLACFSHPKVVTKVLLPPRGENDIFRVEVFCFY